MLGWIGVDSLVTKEFLLRSSHMGGVDFTQLQSSHVMAAAQHVLSHGVPREREARSTWVTFQGTRIPAKYLLGLAYEFATGVRLRPDQFTGGEAAIRVLKGLGFRTFGAMRHQSRRSKSVFRVVTACIAGSPAASAAENKSRERLLACIANEVADRNWEPQILLLPGGYFRLSSHVGNVELRVRTSRLVEQSFSKSCVGAAKQLNCMIVAGVDKTRRGFCVPDQLCVAWNWRKIVGTGRKIFPTDDELNDLVIYEEDLRAHSRLAPIDRRNKALLCSCYDMFGCDERPDSPGKRSKNIRWLWTDANGLLDRQENRHQVVSTLASALADWEALVATSSIGCAAIHYFARSGPGSGKAYWHRHGIVKASRFLGSGLAFAAAHMEPPLPQANIATLAAKRGKTLQPADAFEIDDGAVLVRLFIA